MSKSGEKVMSKSFLVVLDGNKGNFSNDLLEEPEIADLNCEVLINKD
jgi:hypothetical protein